MILVDSRGGSCELIPALVKRGLPVENANGNPPGSYLEYGDVAFLGRGEKGAPLLIGIEHKKVSDLINSLTTGRLVGHQLLGMLAPESGYDRRWLIIEGDWDKDAQGRVTMFRGRGKRRPVQGSPPAIELLMRLIIIGARMGVNLWPSRSQAQTIDFLQALYRAWTDKDLDKHKSHLALYAPDLDRGLLIPVSDFRRIAAQIPGVGFRTSKAIEEYFGGSFRRMMLCPEKELAEVTTRDEDGNTRRLGLARAQKILEALR